VSPVSLFLLTPQLALFMLIDRPFPFLLIQWYVAHFFFSFGAGLAGTGFGTVSGFGSLAGTCISLLRSFKKGGADNGS